MNFLTAEYNAARIGQIKRMFEWAGFIACPLSDSMLSHVVEWGYKDMEIYRIGCSFNSGFSFKDCIAAVLEDRKQVQMDELENMIKEAGYNGRY